MVLVIINLFFWVKTTTFHKVLTKSTLTVEVSLTSKTVLFYDLYIYIYIYNQKKHFSLKNQDNPNENNGLPLDVHPPAPPPPPPAPLKKKKNDCTIQTFIEALNNDVDQLFKHNQTLQRNDI